MERVWSFTVISIPYIRVEKVRDKFTKLKGRNDGGILNKEAFISAEVYLTFFVNIDIIYIQGIHMPQMREVFSMLKIIEATKTYAKSNVKAVDSISLEVQPGEIFGFLGPNGAGKSTTIKMLVGILPFDGGDIEVAGHSIKTDRIEAQRCIGYVPDNHEIYDKLSGNEYINFMADIYGVSAEDRKERSQRFAKMFSLEDALGRQIKSYSHGMKQKITVMGALIHNPKLWVLDEPLTGLDPQSAYELKMQMRQHCDEGNSVFFSSHVLEVVEKVCDRVAIIHQGKIIAVGTIDEIQSKTDLSLEEFFLKVTGSQVSIDENRHPTRHTAAVGTDESETATQHSERQSSAESEEREKIRSADDRNTEE